MNAEAQDEGRVSSHCVSSMTEKCKNIWFLKTNTDGCLFIDQQKRSANLLKLEVDESSPTWAFSNLPSALQNELHLLAGQKPKRVLKEFCHIHLYDRVDANDSKQNSFKKCYVLLSTLPEFLADLSASFEAIFQLQLQCVQAKSKTIVDVNWIEANKMMELSKNKQADASERYRAQNTLGSF